MSPRSLLVLLAAPFAARADDLTELLNRVPGDMNTVAVINVREINKTPRAVKEKWRDNHETEYLAGAIAVPGWVPVVVSNGATRQQEASIRQTGLDRYLADWVISEEAGVSKPNPRIFSIAAERARMRLSGAWVVGDSPEADIGGASAVGLPSVWLHRGRQWGDARYAPTHTVDGPIAALAAVLGH